MRFKSAVVGGYQVLAVSGVNTVSFAIDSAKANTQGLLGFAVEREDPLENERYYLRGFKVFPSVIPNPDENTEVSTFDHPVQSFVWDDFTGKPGRTYHYHFHPLKGAPKKLDRKATPIKITVRMEPQLKASEEHDIFFNRGVASSQAYARRFANKRPDDPTLSPTQQLEALQWLSRELDEAMLKFIQQAKAGDTLLGCFYEFRYLPVLEALKAALDRGVLVKLIVDGKVNEFTDKDGFHESFPREENLRMIKAAKIPLKNVVLLREARANDIQHNKFMVLLKGATARPAAVWTGSTNLSVGGIHGQTNVGHWVRSPALAAQFRDYWILLSGDPGGLKADARSDVLKKNKQFKVDVEALLTAPVDWHNIPPGITPVFSPRSGAEVLEMYAAMLDGAQDLSCVTLAFGINKLFKEQLKDNTPQSHLSFLLLEKQDKPDEKSKLPFIRINASNNVYQAWGSFLREPLHRWAKETSAGGLQLNTHVSFIHSKFMLMDPLGADPIVATGSANFSEASTNDNDENMLLIRGSRRVADIYFTEFNRLFNHYYFRSVVEATAQARKAGVPPPKDGSLELTEDDSWLQKYAPGKLRFKRVQIFVKMKGA
jgi:phosphatidylserine/phosphatidylglycerophosphate/cardiolipin synthase-like enzyme